MKKSQTFLLLLLAILFSSCYTTKISYKNLDLIERGMFPKEVIAILGEPSYRNFDDKDEILEFRSSEYGTAKVVRIRFVDNRVVEMKSYLDSYDSCRDRDKTTKEKKEEKSSEKDTSSKVRVSADGKHFLQSGSIIVTPEGKHEIVVSDQGGLIITASGEHIHAL